jgi:phytoene desaturase
MLMRTDSQGRPSSPHAVVIGCGVGGLAAGARLAAKGYRVTMLDKLDGPGGRAYTYRQDGFTFDAGPTIITAPYVFEDLWQACGRRSVGRCRVEALRSVLQDQV